MRDMAKKILSSLSMFSLNPSISKTVRDTDLKFCTQAGSDDPTSSDLFVNHVVYSSSPTNPIISIFIGTAKVLPIIDVMDYEMHDSSLLLIQF